MNCTEKRRKQGENDRTHFGQSKDLQSRLLLARRFRPGHIPGIAAFELQIRIGDRTRGSVRVVRDWRDVKVLDFANLQVGCRNVLHRWLRARSMLKNDCTLDEEYQLTEYQGGGTWVSSRWATFLASEFRTWSSASGTADL